jgi:hypothetical protein
MNAASGGRGRVALVDLSRVLTHVPGVYFDTGHLYGDGNALIAKHIVGALRGQGLVSTK